MIIETKEICDYKILGSSNFFKGKSNKTKNNVVFFTINKYDGLTEMK